MKQNLPLTGSENLATLKNSLAFFFKLNTDITYNPEILF